jgi:hypothetical protein
VVKGNKGYVKLANRRKIRRKIELQLAKLAEEDDLENKISAYYRITEDQLKKYL